MKIAIAPLLVASLACALACSRAEPPRPTPPAPPAPPHPSVVAAAPAPLRLRPKDDRALPTTSADIHLANLDGQIHELTRLAKLDPKDASRRRMLGGLRYSRAKITGDLDAMAAAIADTTASIAIDPADPDGYLARADQEQALHRFAAARADVDEARARGAKPDAVAAAVQELDWNAGRYDAAIPAIRAAVAKRATVWTLAREAQLRHDLGELDAADHGFEAAEDAIVDTNPVPVAWLDLQRGIHEEARGELDRAVAFFREAARRIPTYVAAEEHLAEALHLAGQDDEAIVIYERVVKESPDPEFKGALASILRAHGRTKEADALKAQATAGYGRLLAKYPEAMYWHASEYFLGEGGDAPRALALLRKNAELRPNATSFAALARAALANGDDAEAKKAIDRALAAPVTSARTLWTAARVAARGGDADAAAAFAARARALNARIDREEPAIDPIARRD